ncbi:MAG: YqeG family HAD IIIA-type phosphatase [Cyanobium sp.]
MLRQLLTPDWTPGCALPQLTMEALEAQAGAPIRALVIDVDRTLLPHRSSQLPPIAERWLQEVGAQRPIHLFSNNPSKRRIGGLSEQLGFPYTAGAAKPRSGALRRVIQNLKVPPSQVALVGDRVFTDVLAGNRLGLFTVLVKPIDATGQANRLDRLQSIELEVARQIRYPLWERWL